MNTGKTYYDSDGNECSIWQMVHREPEWAATRIQVGEAAVEKVQELETQLKENHDRAEGIITAREEEISRLQYELIENTVSANTTEGVMFYKEFSSIIEYSPEDEVYNGKLEKVPYMTDLVMWESENYSGCVGAFIEAVEDYLETRESLDKKPCKPQ
jgi:hypothetical protein